MIEKNILFGLTVHAILMDREEFMSNTVKGTSEGVKVSSCALKNSVSGYSAWLIAEMFLNTAHY